MANKIVPNVPETEQTEETTGTESLVRQHMADQNHIITEEDMMKVQIGKFDENETGEENLSPLMDQTPGKEADENDEEGEQPPPPNPWVVIK